MTFAIEVGETVGFLGLNGAGKTTALRVLACDLLPSGGVVSVDGIDVVANPHEVRKRIGFLPEFPPLYQDMVVCEYLTFAGRMRGMSSAEIRKRLPTVLARTHLDDRADDIIGHLSHGYRQRVGVAQAIIHDPSLLILDEPTRGLDPVQIVEMRNMINELKQSHTILISSHILTEISQTCDHLLVLREGEIVASGSEEELSAGLLEINKIVMTVVAKADAERPGGGEGDAGEAKGDADGDADDGESEKSSASGYKDVIACLEAVAGVVSVEAGHEQHQRARSYRIECTHDLRPEVSRAVVEAGHSLLELSHGHGELERTFVKLVRGDDDASD
ncbi:MAG: hypothetical protein Tsb0020_15980 [Haliangiales bacterium]